MKAIYFDPRHDNPAQAHLVNPASVRSTAPKLTLLRAKLDALTAKITSGKAKLDTMDHGKEFDALWAKVDAAKEEKYKTFSAILAIEDAEIEEAKKLSGRLDSPPNHGVPP